MTIDIINGSCLSPQNRLFPIRFLPDGTPCLIGTAPGEPDDFGTAISVFAATGGLAPMHPDPETGAVWYEVHLGDFVGVYEYDFDLERLFVFAYRIQFIDNDGLAHGVPARID